MSKDFILENIKETLKNTLPNNGTAILFGSQARGDANEHSDWDVLVIVNKNKLTTSDYEKYTYPLTTLGWDLDIDINPILYTEKEWESYRITPFYQNVNNEGIKLV